MAENTLPKTLTVTQALHLLTNEWGRDESTFYKDNTTTFLENVEPVGAIAVEKPKEEGALPDGLDRDRVAVELRRISWRTARAALEFLAEQNPPVTVVPDPGIGLVFAGGIYVPPEAIAAEEP
jgi:hypothetical protein